MKILLVTGSLNQGGAEYQILALANLLKSRCHDVQVLALTSYTYYLYYIKENNLKYSSIDNNGSNCLRLMKSIKAIIQIKPDIIISYIRFPSMVVMLSKVISLKRIRIIISERTSLKLPKYDFFYFNLARLADFITINSLTKLNYINLRFPFLKHRTVFIPNIIDLNKFCSIRKVHSIDNVVRLVYIGRISPEKNLINLIKAFKIVWDHKYKINLLLVGEANNRNYLKEVYQSINALSLSHVVNYKEAVSDVTSIYESCDLLCLVSFYEGFSNVISEGLAAGIPILASDIEENRFLIEDNINGFLVDPQNPSDIAEGIEKYLRLETEKKGLISTHNRLKAKRIFDQNTIYTKYLEILSLSNNQPHFKGHLNLGK